MNQFVLIYAQRKRQIAFVAIVGIFSLILQLLSWKQQPQYLNLQTAGDGRGLRLVQQQWPLAPSENVFLATRTTDGTTYAPATARAGLVLGVAGRNGRFYAIFHDKAALSLGEKDDDWQSISWPLDWAPIGIGTLDNALVTFGQSGDHTKLLTAVLDNGTWRNSASYALPADNIIQINTVRAGGRDFLAWAETKLPPPGARKPSNEELLSLRTRIGLGRIEPGRPDVNVLPRPPIDKPLAGCTFIADTTAVHLYYQDFVASGLLTTIGEFGGPPRSTDPVVHVTTYSDGRWTEPLSLPRADTPWVSFGETAAASFSGKTYIFNDEYFLNTLYIGTWGRELRGSRLSDSFLVVPPTADDLKEEIRWGLSTLAALFAVAGAGVAMLFVRRYPPTPVSGQPLYATVTDRALAALGDFGLLYLLLWLFAGNQDPAGFWAALATVYVVYGAFFESAASGQTLAKRVLGLRVVDATSLGPVAFSAALSRNIFKLIEMITLGAAFCLSTPRYQRPGDFLAGTIVLKELPKFMEPEP